MDNTEKMDNQRGLFTKELRAATIDLAESLGEAEAILNFISANQALKREQKALDLVNAATELQRKIYNGQSLGNDLNNDLKTLRAYQNQISLSAVIQEQSIARESAAAFLRELNQEISQLLGVDFAALTRRPGTGC